MGRVSLVTPALPAGCVRLPLVAYLVMAAVLVCPTWACPEDCSCYQGLRGQIVSCRYQMFPQDLPSDTAEFDTGHTFVGNLSADTFPLMPSLHRLVLDWCQIEHIGDRTFASLPNLETLILSNNRLTDLEVGAFTGLAKLKQLHLDYNQIQRLPHHVFKELSLDELLLHSNKLEKLEDSAFEGTSIVNLNLDENNISNISIQLLNPLKDSLKGLNLSHNAQPLTMEEHVFSGFTFTDLKLSYDGLKDPSFLKHVQAQSLDISGHSFPKLDLRDLDNLKTTQEFYLRNLSIVSLNESILVNLQSVTLLDLSENKLGTLNGDVFRYTPDLKVLILDHNMFTSLPPELGLNLGQLEVLKVAWNRIAVVRPDAFRGMANLKKLDIQNNLIQVIEQSMKPVLQRLETIMLGGNPLHCNCEMKWYRIWLDESKVDTGANDCHSPERKFINTMTPEEFVCRPPTVSYITPNMNAVQGSSVYLTCRAEGDPAPEVQWESPFRETVSVTPPFNRTKHSTSAIWVMQRIKEAQAGWFTCTATNGEGHTSQSMYVHVVTRGGTEIDVDSLTRPTTSTSTTTTTTTPTPPTTTTTTATTTTTTTPSPTPTSTTPEPASSPSTAEDTTPVATKSTEAATTAPVSSETRDIITHSSGNQHSITPGPKRRYQVWHIAVIACSVVGAILLIALIAYFVTAQRKKKRNGKYDVNLESGVPMVSNNNQNGK